MDHKNKLTLISILTLGLALRVLLPSHYPPSLNWDEAALGYNAFSLLQTGRDEFGTQLPLVLRSFDDYKSALYSYLTVPFVALLGLNESSIRAVSAFSGLSIILSGYFFTYYLTRNRLTALTSALLLAIEPWAILFSRGAFEANLALALYLAGITLALYASHRPKLLLPSLTFLILSAYAYHSSKILLPPTLLALLCYHRKLLLQNSKLLRTSFLTLLFLSLPLLYSQLSTSHSLNRLVSTSLLDPNHPLFTTLEEICARYLSYYSPINYFVRGTPEPTQYIAGFAMFYNLEFFFWVAGLICLLKRPHKFRPLLFLIAIAPLPAVITWNWFYPARVLLLFFCFTVVTSLGVNRIYQALPSKLTLLCLLGIATLYSTNLAFLTLFDSARSQRGAWQYGMKEIITEISKVQTEYDTVVFETRTAQPHIFVLLYSQYDPQQYQAEIKHIASDSSPRKDFNFGKFIFRDVYWFRQDENAQNTLLVGPPSSLPSEKIAASSAVDRFLAIKDQDGNVLAHLVGMK